MPPATRSNHLTGDDRPEGRSVQDSMQDWQGSEEISLDMPLIDVVCRLRPTVTLRHRLLHDRVLAEMSLRDVVADPAGTWQAFRMVPGAGPVAAETFCDVVAEVLRRSGGRIGDMSLTRQQIHAIRRSWHSPPVRRGAGSAPGA